MRSATRLTEVAGPAEPPTFQVHTPAMPAEAAAVARDAFDSRWTDLLALSLKALSQRALVALSSLFTLLVAASAFWLWLSVLPAPTPLQLVGVGGYAVFVLALEFVRRK